MVQVSGQGGKKGSAGGPPSLPCPRCREPATSYGIGRGYPRSPAKLQPGWTDIQMPDRIYADPEADHAREEAKAMRTRIRGELQEEKTQ